MFLPDGTKVFGSGYFFSFDYNDENSWVNQIPKSLLSSLILYMEQKIKALVEKCRSRINSGKNWDVATFIIQYYDKEPGNGLPDCVQLAPF